MSASNIKHMVERFLSWRLPADFAPDGGISFEPTYRFNATEIRREPIGTNLLTYTQAEAMVRHMLVGMPETPHADRDGSGLTGDALREELECTCGAGHGSGEGHTDWCDWAAMEAQS